MADRTIKKGDFIKLNFTGYLKESGEVFDTTYEQKAKEAGLYEQGKKYKPLIVVAGKGQVIKGLDHFLIGKPLGEYHVEVKPEDAFGKRNAKLVKLMSKSVFTKHNINPFPGLRVEMDNVLATIVSVSGSRVLVDFNHPLAGKTLIYDLKVEGFIDDKKEQVKILASSLFGKEPKVEEKDGKYEISWKDLDENSKRMLRIIDKELKKEIKDKAGVEVEIKI